MNNKTSNYDFTKISGYLGGELLSGLTNESGGGSESKTFLSMENTAVNGLIFQKEEENVVAYDLEGNKIDLGGGSGGESEPQEEVEIFISDKPDETPLFTINPKKDGNYSYELVLNNLSGEILNNIADKLEEVRDAASSGGGSDTDCYYRTLYLGNQVGLPAINLFIVWAPNAERSLCIQSFYNEAALLPATGEVLDITGDARYGRYLNGRLRKSLLFNFTLGSSEAGKWYYYDSSYSYVELPATDGAVVVEIQAAPHPQE